jgi:spore coat protein A, manganese oxidase
MIRRARFALVTIPAALVSLILCVSAGVADPLPGGTLSPAGIVKYVSPLIIPPVMPPSGNVVVRGGKNAEYYEIAVRQFQQQILPDGMPPTTVWGYGSITDNATFHSPSFTIEARWNKPVRIKWINDLVDENGDFRPHLLPVDQTLHWANPPMACIEGDPRTDCRGTSQAPYLGPVPIVTHVHGAHTTEDSDGYPEAWYLPAAGNIPTGHDNTGTLYDDFKTKAEELRPDAPWGPGFAVFQYPNDQRATTLWYHDHTLGITRLNVYAGPAGFYLVRGGPDDVPGNILPGPGPALGDPTGTRYYEIPIVVQDRSFNADGSLFYPDNRAFFEGLAPFQLQIPYIPDNVISGDTDFGASDVSPIWNPEFFGNTTIVNGRTWPYLEVEPRRYRFRFLNGSNSRFLILTFDNMALNNTPPSFWQIGAEGGFLPAPVELDSLLIGPAERADVIVDFGGLTPGDNVILLNLGPDEPFKGFNPDGTLADGEGGALDPADPGTTGQVMQFRVVGPVPKTRPDTSIDPASGHLPLPPLKPLGPASGTRRLSLNEEESAVVLVTEKDGNIVLDAEGEPFGPVAALLGVVEDGFPVAKMWSEGITENPDLGATEIWEIYNFTMDAHPIHVHMVQFQVVDRQALETDEEGMVETPVEPVGSPLPPEPWETGFKDTVIAYPGQVTRIKARFDIPGLFVWHCHILEHEDNEMMRPYHVGPMPATAPVPMSEPEMGFGGWR